MIDLTGIEIRVTVVDIVRGGSGPSTCAVARAVRRHVTESEYVHVTPVRVSTFDLTPAAPVNYTVPLEVSDFVSAYDDIIADTWWKKLKRLRYLKPFTFRLSR